MEATANQTKAASDHAQNREEKKGWLYSWFVSLSNPFKHIQFFLRVVLVLILVMKKGRK